MEKRTSAFDIFNSAYEESLKFAASNEKAYERAEEKFKSAQGFTPYSGYDSFRTLRSRKLKKR